MSSKESPEIVRPTPKKPKSKVLANPLQLKSPISEKSMADSPYAHKNPKPSKPGLATSPYKIHTPKPSSTTVKIPNIPKLNETAVPSGGSTIQKPTGTAAATLETTKTQKPTGTTAAAALETTKTQKPTGTTAAAALETTKTQKPTGTTAAAALLETTKTQKPTETPPPVKHVSLQEPNGTTASPPLKNVRVQNLNPNPNPLTATTAPPPIQPAATTPAPPKGTGGRTSGPKDTVISMDDTARPEVTGPDWVVEYEDEAAAMLEAEASKLRLDQQRRPSPAADIKPKRKRRTPQLCCCSLREGVISMASFDLIFAMLICIAFGIQIPSPEPASSDQFLFPLLGMIAAFVFLGLSFLLFWTVAGRNKIVGWIFMIFNALLFIGCVVCAYVFFREYMRDVSTIVLLSLTLLYKIYETVCVYFFIYEQPRARILFYTDMQSGVVPVVYAPQGVYYYNHRPGYGYYNPGLGLVTGLALGSMMSHGLFW